MINFIPEIRTFFIAMTPIGELRAAIPVALKVYGMPVWSAFFFSVMGNLLPVVFLLLFLEPVSEYLRERFLVFEKFFSWLFEKTRKKHQKKFQRWKKFALVILVAIPLPFTGAWTGSICAFLFGIHFKHAFPLILLGVIIAGVIVTLTTQGLFKFI